VNTGVGIEERRTALAPYLERLGRLDGETERPEGADDPLVLVLGDWEQRAVRDALASGAETPRSWESLLAEGVALQKKYFAEVDALAPEGTASPDGEEQLRQRLLHSLAIGLALMEELQREVNGMILGGDVAQAKKLTGFRNKLGQLIMRIKERVDVDGIVLAQALAAEMITPVESRKESAASRLAEEPEEEGPTQPIRLETRHRPLGHMLVREEKKDRLKPLLIVLAVAVAVWAVLILPRAWAPSIPELGDQDLAFSPAIRQVIARPPSLYLVMDGAKWEGMPQHQREELVRQIGETAGGAGYSGVQLRLDDGTTLAQWSETRGVKLVPRSRTGT
jgi:hypothetical protein